MSTLNWKTLPNSSLAYLGDACYEFLLREWLLSRLHAKSGALHKLGIRFANAKYQSSLASLLREEKRLSAEEEEILLRGRNANPGTMAKHASPMEYRWATGLETLLGYWHLTEQDQHMKQLLVEFWTRNWEEFSK